MWIVKIIEKIMEDFDNIDWEAVKKER